MKFSVCIPNYNYAAYVGRTIQSALDQTHRDVEVLVADNASTDDSVEVVRSIRDDRVSLKVNACNVGFAGNLDKVVQMATGDWIILLSSDDLLRPTILEQYAVLANELGPTAGRSVFSSTNDLIDPDDAVTGRLGPDTTLWRESDRAPELEALMRAPVYRMSSTELLSRCLQTMRNPFNFATTAYPRALYEQIEGYGGGRIINPDKWFHWRLLGVADHAYFVDLPLGALRWHPSNQTAQQKKSGALKYLVDEYVTTFQIEDGLLRKAGLTRTDFERRFVEYDIGRHGLATLANGNAIKARRILKFAEAAFPEHTARNQKVWALRALLAAGPVGGAVSRLAYRAFRRLNA